ncbi:MAG: hypothetical protein R2796_07665 [Chitinophagaceae bacterium]|nr:hypothetical protein [Chitinophagaceae bacterium]
MRLFLRILFFIITIFQTNISEAKITAFGNVITETKFTCDILERKAESIRISENDFEVTCNCESNLVDYRNWAISVARNAAKTGGTFYRAMSNAEYAALQSNNGLTHMAGEELFVC